MIPGWKKSSENKNKNKKTKIKKPLQTQLNSIPKLVPRYRRYFVPWQHPPSISTNIEKKNNMRIWFCAEALHSEKCEWNSYGWKCETNAHNTSTNGGDIERQTENGIRRKPCVRTQVVRCEIKYVSKKYYCRRRQLLTEPSENLCRPRPAYLPPEYVAHLIPPMNMKKKKKQIGYQSLRRQCFVRNNTGLGGIRVE